MVYPSPTGRASPQEAKVSADGDVHAVVVLHDEFPVGQPPWAGHAAPVAPFAVVSSGDVVGEAPSIFSILTFARGEASDLTGDGRMPLLGAARRAWFDMERAPASRLVLSARADRAAGEDPA